MLRHWKIFILFTAAVLPALVAGKLLAIAVLTILLPIYALLLASIFLIGFIALASIVVPICQSLLDGHESAIEIHEEKEHHEAA
jgi:hypothetical protein